MAESTGIPAGAREALVTFLDASGRGDEEAMRACLSRNTIEAGGFRPDAPKGVEFTVGEARREDGLVVIPIRPNVENPEEIGLPPGQLPCVMVEEEGGWKLDLATTMDRLFGGTMRSAMEQMAGAMEQMVEGVGEAISGALGGSPATEEPPEEDPPPGAESV